jgi:hypothetical protein
MSLGRDLGLDGEWQDVPLTRRAANVIARMGKPSPSEVLDLLNERRGDGRLEPASARARA